jgi:hypothetical protein
MAMDRRPYPWKLTGDRQTSLPQPSVQDRITHILWTHSHRPVQFSLVVDDFGVKYVGKQHADHLMNALQEIYEVSEDWEGKLYCGITLNWDYD